MYRLFWHFSNQHRKKTDRSRCTQYAHQQNWRKGLSWHVYRAAALPAFLWLEAVSMAQGCTWWNGLFFRAKHILHYGIISIRSSCVGIMAALKRAQIQNHHLQFTLNLKRSTLMLFHLIVTHCICCAIWTMAQKHVQATETTFMTVNLAWSLSLQMPVHEKKSDEACLYSTQMGNIKVKKKEMLNIRH